MQLLYGHLYAGFIQGVEFDYLMFFNVLDYFYCYNFVFLSWKYLFALFIPASIMLPEGGRRRQYYCKEKSCSPGFTLAFKLI